VWMAMLYQDRERRTGIIGLVFDVVITLMDMLMRLTVPPSSLSFGEGTQNALGAIRTSVKWNFCPPKHSRTSMMQL